MTQIRQIKDKIVSKLFLIVSLNIIALLFIIGISLYSKSELILCQSSALDLVTSNEWKPFKSVFGFWPYISGTLNVVGISILISFPISLLTGLYIHEFAPRLIKKIILPVIDLLAGIPPIIYGVWGSLLIVPLVRDYIAIHFVEYSSGYSLLSGAIVLAAMTLPLTIKIILEVFNTIPKELNEASDSLGATPWQTAKHVILRKAWPGIFAALILSISRGLGETIAVLMVCGNVAEIPHTLFDPVYPLPALLANNYGEILSQPLYESALMFAALLLFVIIVVFNAISRLVLYRLERSN